MRGWMNECFDGWMNGQIKNEWVDGKTKRILQSHTNHNSHIVILVILVIVNPKNCVNMPHHC